MNLQDIQRRTHRYFYEDGLIEIAVGTALLVVGLALLAVNNAPRYLTVFLVVLLPIFGAGAVYLASRIAEAAKERVVYPRTGYVAYRQPGEAYQRRFIVGGLLVLTAIVVLLPGRLNSMSVMQGVIFAFIFTALGHRLGIVRFYGLAVGALVVGVGVALTLPLSPVVATTGTLTGIGLSLLLSGGVAFLGYLRRNPEASTDDSH